jgi:succinyl-CoA synthetase alpha subunit
MGINNRIMKENGVIQSVVLMGSDSNKEVLKELGFSDPKIDHASANDLVVGVISSSQEVIDSILNNLSAWLTEVRVQKSDTAIHSLREAVDQNLDANLVSISVPGEFAGNEARKSLEAGLNVFLFSDNVSVEDELSLKQYARTKDLLVMGPDCGTSIIGGIGLGFSNAVRRGPIGVIAAAGTGLQEFTCMVHNAGSGISHAIGTGGRDLSDAIGGLTTLSALDVLEQDKNTQVIVILSKPPGKNTLTKLVNQFTKIDKPIIGCFIGIEDTIEGEGTLFKRAKIIDEAVELAIKQVGGNLPTDKSDVVDSQNLKRKYLPVQKYLRGVFAGGTFCFQAQQLLKSAGIKVYSNSPIDRAFKLKHPDNSIENSIVDMGDEYYMVGRPHPMIDGSQRALRILKEARDPEVAVILLDFILGYNASRDPVGELAEAIQEAGNYADKQGRHLEFVASVCGTADDKQDMGMQKQMLKNIGVIVFESNAAAVRYCADLLYEVNHA